MDQDIEQRLIAGCKRGESWAMKELYDRYASCMLSICVRYVSDSELAKDVLQDGFVKVFTKVRQFEERGAFSGWLRQIFVTTSLEYLRRNKVFDANVRMEDIAEEPEEFENNLLEHISADDLMECVAKLPDRYRAVFNLHAIEELNHNEIGEKLGINESTSRTQFYRARKILQRNILNLMNNK